ncbi:MAG: tetratricopeptide repeat protein [Streptosporangiaceae bacterium]
MAVLSREEFDAIEFEAAISGDHRAAAERMTALAANAEPTDSMPRAEALVRAGEQWLLADEPDAAVQDFRAAIADGGRVEVDPRAPLCRALFQLGKGDEARALIEKMRTEGRSDPRACDVITELLVEQADLPGALDWATAGVELILQGAGQPGDGNYTGLNDLLRLRYRIRNDLRLPEDEYDRMLATD